LAINDVLPLTAARHNANANLTVGQWLNFDGFIYIRKAGPLGNHSRNDSERDRLRQAEKHDKNVNRSTTGQLKQAHVGQWSSESH